jgi:hypothetical protein
VNVEAKMINSGKNDIVVVKMKKRKPPTYVMEAAEEMRLENASSASTYASILSSLTSLRQRFIASGALQSSFASVFVIFY